MSSLKSHEFRNIPSVQERESWIKNSPYMFEGQHRLEPREEADMFYLSLKNVDMWGKMKKGIWEIQAV